MDAIIKLMGVIIKLLKLTGWKVYITGIGFIGLGIYQISDGHSEEGVKSILAGFGSIGGRAAFGKLLDKKSTSD